MTGIRSKFLALRGRQPAVATAAVTIRLGNPVPDRLRRRFKLRSQFLWRTAGAHQFHHLATELSCVGQSCLGHRGLLGPKRSGVHETGSTSIIAYTSDDQQATKTSTV